MYSTCLLAYCEDISPSLRQIKTFSQSGIPDLGLFRWFAGRKSQYKQHATKSLSSFGSLLLKRVTRGAMANASFASRLILQCNIAFIIFLEYFPTTYKGKRFWIESRPLGVNCEQARTICSLRGGHMANIYDRDHHYALMARLRLLTAYNGVMTAWTGMSYNNEVSLVFVGRIDDARRSIVHRRENFHQTFNVHRW